MAEQTGGPPPQRPSIGRIVVYHLGPDDDKTQNNNQLTVPAVVTAVWSDTVVNLKVLNDGETNWWRTSMSYLDPADPAFRRGWSWPPRV